MIATDYIFGRKAAAQDGGGTGLPFNTIVSGVAGTYPTITDFASRTTLATSDISFFEVIGDNIFAKVNADYDINSSGFYAAHVNCYIDLEGRVKSVGGYAFGGRNMFKYGYFPAATYAGVNMNSNGGLYFFYAPAMPLLGDSTAAESVIEGAPCTIYGNSTLLNSGDADLTNKTLVTADTIKPGQVSGVTVTPYAFGAKFTFPGVGADMYFVLVDGYVRGWSNDTNIVADRLDPSTAYKARIISVSAGGCIELSDEIEFTTTSLASTNFDTAGLVAAYIAASGASNSFTDSYAGNDATTVNAVQFIWGDRYTGVKNFGGWASYAYLPFDLGMLFPDANNQFAFAFSFIINSNTQIEITIAGYAQNCVVNYRKNEQQVILRMRGGATTLLTGVQLGKSYFVGVSWNGSQAVVCADGVEMAGNVGTAALNDLSPNGIRVGQPVSGGNTYFSGKIEKMYWYNQPKTFAQLNEIFNNGYTLTL